MVTYIGGRQVVSLERQSSERSSALESAVPRHSNGPIFEPAILYTLDRTDFASKNNDTNRRHQEERDLTQA